MTATVPYLDSKVTGSRWLFDPARMRPDAESVWKKLGDPVDPHKAARDIITIGDLMRDAYGRYDQYKTHNVDLDAVLAAQAKRVDAMPAATFQSAFLPVLIDLRASLPDNHLDIGIDGAWKLVSQDPRVITREFRGDPNQLAAAQAVAGAALVTAARVPLVTASGSIGEVGSISVQGIEGVEALHSLGYRAVSEIVPDEQTVPKNSDAYKLTSYGATAVIKLGSFDNSDPDIEKALNRFVEDAPQHRRFRNLVFDLRGNSGGDDGYVYGWIGQMLAESTKLSTYSHQTYPSGKTQALATWNLGAWVSTNIPNHPGKDFMNGQAQDSKKLWPLSEKTPFVDEPQQPETGVAKKDWHGKVIVLVDRHSSSSAESSALMLKNWLGATIAGERTSGTLEGNNGMNYSLPETGVEIHVPSRATKYDDPRVGEAIGIPIDFALEQPAAQAIDVARAIWKAS